MMRIFTLDKKSAETALAQASSDRCAPGFSPVRRGIWVKKEDSDRTSDRGSAQVHLVWNGKHITLGKRDSDRGSLNMGVFSGSERDRSICCFCERKFAIWCWGGRTAQLVRQRAGQNHPGAKRKEGQCPSSQYSTIGRSSSSST